MRTGKSLDAEITSGLFPFKEDYMRWFIYAPLQLLIMIICYITNPIVVLFADKDGELHGFLRKWQTFDDSCDSEDCVTKYVPETGCGMISINTTGRRNDIIRTMDGL